METRDDSYYAVIFTAEMSDDTAGYADMAQRMTELVEQQPGYIGKHTSMEGNRELTVSYWESLAAIKAWKAHPEHRAAQELLMRKRFVEAVATYREALTLDPDYVPAHAGIGEALFHLGHQLVWTVALVLIGRWVLSRGLHRLVVQGG